MGKFIWGSLAAFVLLFGFAPVAGADPIPPTSGCQAILRKSLDDYYKEASKGKLSAKEERLWSKQVSTLLESNGCISDAEPLYKKVEVKPFAAQCFEAAAKGNRYWALATRRIVKAARPFIRKVVKPHNRRVKSINQRIKSLRANGRSGRVAALVSKRKAINRAYGKRARVALKRLMPMYRDVAYDSVLIIYEFLSLRCVAADITKDNRPNAPVQKTLEKNGGLVFSSMLFLLFKYEDVSKARSLAEPVKLPIISFDRRSFSRR